MSSKIEPCQCDCEYPCSCILYEGEPFGGLEDIIDHLEVTMGQQVKITKQYQAIADKALGLVKEYRTLMEKRDVSDRL